MRLSLLGLVVLAVGCRDWGTFSTGYGQGGGASGNGGGASALGGGASTGGGATGGSGGGGAAAGGGGTTAGGGTATGGGGGGADPTSCASRGTFTCPTALFCDGFDEAAFKPAWTVDTTPNATMTDSDACKYRGTRAAHAHVDTLAADVEAHAEIAEGDADLPSDVFVRVFVRVDSADAPVTELVTLEQLTPGIDAVRLVLAGGALGMDGTVTVPTGTHALGTGRWVCVEWEVLSGTPNTTHVWLDESAAISGTFSAGSLGRVVLGARIKNQSTGVSTATEVGFDDLVVDTARIHCN